ncbi:MAG: S41 family peptidase, partial [Myxococcota bacterium]
MRRLWVLLLVLTACQRPTAESAKASVEEPAGISTLTAKEVAEDVALLLDVMRSVHPGYTRYANPENPELLAAHDAAVQALKDLAGSGASTLSLYQSVSRYAASLRCDHTKTEYPEAYTEWRRSHPSHLPFRILTDGAEMRVFSAALVSALSPGDRIDAFDGIPTPEVISRIGELISVDGYTEHARPHRLESDSDLMGSALDHYLPALFGDRESLPLNVTRLGGGQATVTVPLITFEEWKTLPGPGGTYRADFSNAVFLNFPTPGVATLRIDSFVNYRNPMDPEAIYRSVLANLRGRDVQSLIIDLRQNGGGSDRPMVELIRALARAPFVPQRPSQVATLDLKRFAPHLGTWDPRALEPDPSQFRALDTGFYEQIPGPADFHLQELAPAPNAFAGDVILLLGYSNASGVTHLASKLVDMGRVITVGEPTGGSA